MENDGGPGKGYWEVFRHHRLMTNDDGYHRRALAWIRSLGLDPRKIQPEWAVIRHGGFYELHVSEMQWDGRGKYVVDYARNEVVTVPVILSLGPVAHGRTWPEPHMPDNDDAEASDALAGA